MINGINCLSSGQTYSRESTKVIGFEWLESDYTIYSNRNYFQYEFKVKIDDKDLP